MLSLMILKFWLDSLRIQHNFPIFMCEFVNLQCTSDRQDRLSKRFEILCLRAMDQWFFGYSRKGPSLFHDHNYYFLYLYLPVLKWIDWNPFRTYMIPLLDVKLVKTWSSFFASLLTDLYWKRRDFQKLLWAPKKFQNN